MIVLFCFLWLILHCAQSGTNATEQNTSITESSQPDDFLTSEFDLSKLNSDSSFLPDSDSSELFYRTMLAISIVIVLGISAIYATKKLLPKIANTSGKEIQVVETVHLGPRKSIHLIKIGKQRLLIGSTNENICKLADLTNTSIDISTQNN